MTGGGAEVDVLPYGLVLDFVLSDSTLQAWDNTTASRYASASKSHDEARKFQAPAPLSLVLPTTRCCIALP